MNGARLVSGSILLPDEFVTEAADGADLDGRTGGAEFLAQIADIDFNVIVGRGRLAAPDVGEQVGFGLGLVGVAEEEFEQFGFFGGESDGRGGASWCVGGRGGGASWCVGGVEAGDGDGAVVGVVA